MARARAKQDCLIHVGYHKTGTTTLQQAIFVEALGFRKNAGGRKRLHELFVRPGALASVSAADIKSLGDEIAATSADNLTLVLSHERLSGYPPAGGFDQPQIATRLHQACPDAKILMVIREQRSLIYSAWKQQIVDGGAQSLKRFLKETEPDVKRAAQFDPDFYDFNRAYDFYCALFGADRVLCLPFEMMVRDLPGFCERMAAFTGAKALAEVTEVPRVNESRSLLHLYLRRIMNSLLFRRQLNGGGLIDYDSDGARRLHRGLVGALSLLDGVGVLDSVRKGGHHQKVAAYVGDRYAASNKALSDKLGINLGELGYL